MRGIQSWSAYLPYRRLDRTQIAPFVGQGGGKGTRTVASFDEDSTTMGVEAARLALRDRDLVPAQLLFATTFPAYADKTNATAIHAALRLARHHGRVRLRRCRVRSAVGALLLALDGRRGPGARGRRRRPHRPAGQRRRSGRRRRRRRVRRRVRRRRRRSSPSCSGSASVTDEFVDRWRAPGEQRTKVWDERFSEISYMPARGAGVERRARDGRASPRATSALAAVVAPGQRVARSMGGKLDGVARDRRPVADGGQRGRGAARTAARRAARAGRSRSGRRAGRARRRRRRAAVPRHRRARRRTGRRARSPRRSRAGAPLPYGKFLAWRGMLPVEPPRRPEPQTRVGHRGGAQRGLEVRLRRLEGARHRRGAPAAGARVARRRAHRRDGSGAARRRAGHDRHVHRRPPGVLAEPADRVRGRRLRRRRPAARRAHRRRRRRGRRSASGSR